MRKTSVYLPDGLKARLAEVARRTGRSEAHLVRLAVERLVAAELVAASGSASGGTGVSAGLGPRDDPAVARNRPAPCLVGVGMGPGDPGLVTTRAVAALRAADRVLAPTTSAAAVGRAEAIVREAVPEVAVERVVFVMETDGAARAAALGAAADRVVALLDVGERVAFVTLGDPNVYSTFASVAAEVRIRRPAVPIESIPGIMAFQDLAARSGTVLVDGDEQLVLVPAHRGDGAASVAAALVEDHSAVVVYKGGSRLPELAAALAAAGRLDGAVLGELLGLPGGRVARVADVADRPATYLATLVVPPVR